MMSVHYKFKSSLDFDTISFDGLHISVADLKKEIINKKKLGKTQDFDLQITNAQTKEEYSEDSCLIPKNTSLIIARVPLATRLVKKAWDPTSEKAAASTTARERKNADAQAANIDLTLMNGTEEEKINAMMKQSTMDYDPRKFSYQKVRGSAQTGEVPSTYRCYKCNKMGHWIKNCPLNVHHDASHTEIKRSTGIPRSFIDAGNSPATEPINLPPIEKKQEIPDDLICSICKDLFTDAVMIPCCGSSFCDECVRTALLESEDNECPDCQEKGSSPGSLIPNRFLRNSVNSFKNETGYNKPRQPKKTPVPVEESVQPPSEEVATKIPSKTVNSEETSTNTEGEKANVPETVETKEQENDEASRDCDTPRAGSAHDESDFEDNIIVTVPKPQSHNNYHDYRDRQNLNGRYNRLTNINEVEQSTNQPPSHQYADKEHYGADMKHMSEMNMRYGMQQHQQQHPPMMQQPMPHRQGPPNQMQTNNFHPSAPNSWWNHPNRFGHSMHGKPIDSEMHPHQQMNHMHHRSYGPIPHQPPQMQIRGYTPVQHHPIPQMHRPMMHQESNIVATAFQGVANKIGTGIIEDPLAAFEQIMKEKERRKIQRRAAIDSPPRRRSRSGERRRSPMDRRSPRHNSQDSRDRGRSTGKGERSSSRNRDRRSDKRGRSPDRRRSPIERRRRRSASYHSRQSRSYSRSRSNTPPRRHSRSPPRKHSRSPQDRRSRSRSASYSMNRNRYRRDYRDREEYVERSPNFYPSRGRGSYRGRGRGNYYRQDRNSMQQQHHQHQSGGTQQNPNVPYYDQSMNLMNTAMSSSQGGYNDGVYHDTQPNRYAPVSVHSPSNIHVGGGLQQNHEFVSQIGHAVQEIHPVDANYSNEGNQSYDVLPPGVDREPPPPGFENEEQQAQHHLRPHLNRESRSPTRSNIERDRGERSDRKHHSKSPSSREQVRSKSGDGRSQYEKDSTKSTMTVNRTKDLDKKDQREKEKSVREKEKEREKDRDKDDDKRERKSKDKKKKKKEEKLLEKKRKKDKKEKREKDSKKSSNKSHSHCSSGNEEKHLNSSEKEILPNKASPESHHETALSHSTTPPPLIQQNVHKSLPVEEETNIDLYGDITIEIENGENNPNDDFGITNSPVSRLNRSDSILDIHTNVDFEDADLPKSESEAQNSKEIPPTDTFVTLPEPSKWERDEDLLAEKTDLLPVEDQTKVTNEVLKRAENAIFARAINAIRPSIEIKKICPERQKLYSNEVTSEQEKSPTTLSAAHVEKASDNLLQITVLNTEQERSVEIKSGSRQSRNKTPIRSIKDRLGKKLNEDAKTSAKTSAKSKSRTPQRKIIAENRSDRARDDRRRDRTVDSDRNRKYRSPKSSDNRRGSVTRRNDVSKSSEKVYRERERRHSEDREDRDTKENKDRKRSGRDGNEKDGLEFDRGREQHKVQVEKATRDIERDRELQKARVRARIREEERTKAQREGNLSTKEKKSSTSSVSTTDRRKRFELNTDSRSVGTMLEGKHHDIDESNFEPNYEAQPSDESPLKSKSSDQCTNRSKSKTKSENRKRSRSFSSSSSSSSDSNSSDSSSDSEERKRKRKRKHKKQKKSKKSKKKKKTKK